MEARTLLYFGYSPAEGAGSAIIVYRHLLRFAADGWLVRIVADFGQSEAVGRQHDWPVMTLLHRKKWWPPFNPNSPLSRAFRAWLWAGEVDSRLDGIRPSGVLTYLSAFSDTLSIAAAGYASRYRIPMAVLVHDDSRCFVESAEFGQRAHARRQWILQRSTKSWFASPELANCFRLPSHCAGVLPPIPEGRGQSVASWHSSSMFASPLLIYAGNYWPPQIASFARLSAATRLGGGRFLAILKENPEDVARLREFGVEWRAPFEGNMEALDYLRTHAASLVVSYSERTDEMPWTRTSFPSKLIEYCHLGVPIVIVAPSDAAVVRWARDRAFPDVFAPDDLAGFTNYVMRLRSPDFRRERADVARSFADGEFAAEPIHRKLEASLLDPL